MKKFLIPFFTLIPWASLPPQWIKEVPDLSTKIIALGSKDCKKTYQSFQAKVAVTPASRELGLGNRKQLLKKHEAMLFLFDQPQILNFWMKGTYIPLVIAYFGLDGKILNIEKMDVEKNPMEPRRNYFSDGIANAAVEVSPQTLTKDAYLCIEK